MKEVLLLIRDLAGLLIIFLMPMVLVFVMALIQDSTFRKMDETRLSVLFIDEDGELVGPAIHDGLDSSKMISLHTTYEGIELDRQKLIELVSEGKYQIGIIIPDDATDKLKMKAAALVEKAFEDEDYPVKIPEFETAGIILYFDPVIKRSFRETARMALARLTYAIEARMVFDLFSEKVSEITNSEAVIEYDPSGIIQLVEHDATNEHTEVVPNSVQHNVPAWAVFAMFFILIPLTGNIIRERNSGSMLRIRLMPGSYMVTILAKIIVYLLISIIQFILMLLVGILILPLFGLPLLDLGDHLFALLLMIVASGLAATGFGLALGSIFNTPEQAAAFGSVAVIILAALGGIWVPVFMMPKIMQDISILSPLNWGLEGFYTIFLRNGSCVDIMPWVIPLVVFSLVCMVVAFYFLRLKKN
jgi:ABC-2 type transport system permease protein